MKRLLLATCLALAPLAGCVGLSDMPNIKGGPGVIANQTVLDEKTGIAIETAYSAAAEAATLAIRAGVVSPATAQRIADVDRRAYAAVQATRAAYDAGNSSSYQVAAAQALPLLREMLALVKGN